MNNRLRIKLLAAMGMVAASVRVPVGATPEDFYGFGDVQRVPIDGYDGIAMEPFVTADNAVLLFNNSNDPAADTNIHIATSDGRGRFRYAGELRGVNSRSLDGVPSVDHQGKLYFVSTRSLAHGGGTVYRAQLRGFGVDWVTPVQGLKGKRPNEVVFDVSISPDGATLWISLGRFDAGPVPTAAWIETADVVDGLIVRPGIDTRRLGSLALNDLQYAACQSRDGLELFFTSSAAHGTPSIFMAFRQRRSEPFGRPQLLDGLGMHAEAPALSPDEGWLYFHAKTPYGFGIYRARRL